MPKTILGWTALGVVLALGVLGRPGPVGAATEPPADAEGPDDAEPTDTEPPVETPDPGQTPTAPPVETPDKPDRPIGAESALDVAELERIRTEARDLRDEIFKARARVATVASKLFKSKITMQIRSNLERFYVVSDVVITVDGAPVVQKQSGLPQAADSVFELFAAPGSHEIGVSAKLVSRREQTYKLRMSQTFVVVVPENSTLNTKLVLRENGNIWRFTKRRRGAYRLRVSLRARAKSNDKRRGRNKAKAKASVSVGGKAK